MTQISTVKQQQQDTVSLKTWIGVIGGWLTDNLGWEYNFYLNIIPGIIMLAAIAYAIPAKPMQLNQLKRGDWGRTVSF